MPGPPSVSPPRHNASPAGHWLLVIGEVFPESTSVRKEHEEPDG